MRWGWGRVGGSPRVEGVAAVGNSPCQVLVEPALATDAVSLLKHVLFPGAVLAALQVAQSGQDRPLPSLLPASIHHCFSPALPLPRSLTPSLGLF